MLLARGPEAYLLYHRGITHSIAGLAVLPPLLALGLWWGLGRETPLRWLLLLCWAGAGLHVAYDLVTSWGTMLLYPFDLQRFSLDWLFIVDPFTWILPAVAILAARRRPDRSRTAAVAFVVAMAAYVLLSGAVHGSVRRAIVDLERSSDRPAAEVFAFPQPLAPWRWHGVAVVPPSAAEPRVDRFRIDGLPPAPILVERIPRGFDEPWAIRAVATADGQAYLWWSRAPFARVDARGEAVTVTLADLRFVRSDRPAAAGAPFSLRLVFDPATGELEAARW